MNIINLGRKNETKMGEILQGEIEKLDEDINSKFLIDFFGFDVFL